MSTRHSLNSQKGASILPTLIVVVLLVIGAAYMVGQKAGISHETLSLDELTATSTPAAIIKSQ